MIVHCAASVSFDLSLEQARAINVEGTRRMLELAGRAQELGVLERYAQVSTAYVAGTHAGRFSECDLDVGQSFHNSYEQSKFESEQLVRSRPGLPFTILRPSIVVGDRHSGWTSAFNVLYWPLRALARGLFPAVPAIASAPVDVVSIDYVADGILRSCARRPAAPARPITSPPARRRARSARSPTSPAVTSASRRRKLLSPAEFESLDHGLATLDDRGRAYVLPVLLGGDDVRRRGHARPARARRDQRRAAARLPEPPARLRDAGSRWGKRADRAGRRGGRVRPGDSSERRSAHVPPAGGLSPTAALLRGAGAASILEPWPCSPTQPGSAPTIPTRS